MKVYNLFSVPASDSESALTQSGNIYVNASSIKEAVAKVKKIASITVPEHLQVVTTEYDVVATQTTTPQTAVKVYVKTNTDGTTELFPIATDSATENDDIISIASDTNAASIVLADPSAILLV